MMSYLNGVEYESSHEFSREQIIELTPEDLMRWMNYMVYENEDPPEDASPGIQSSTVAFWKKALSFFMVNRLMVWNEVNNVGNPTSCTQLNELIKHTKKMEVIKKGVQSQARRSINDDEFLKVMGILKGGRSSIWKYGTTCLLNFQFHMITRIDDCVLCLMENIIVHPRFEFCLRTKLSWGKNVHEERDLPWQIILGFSKSINCCLILLGLWLEVFFTEFNYADQTPYLFAFYPDCRMPEGGKAGKSIVGSLMGDQEFKEAGLVGMNAGGQSGGLGTHSYQKKGSTHARKNGIGKDDHDFRGRWRGHKRVSDVYDDTELPWVDTKHWI